MRKVSTVLVSLVFLAFTSSCKNDKSAAEDQVRRFRAQITRGEFDAIYDTATPQFRQSTPKKGFTDALMLIKDEVSEPGRFVLADWKLTRELSGATFVALTYVPAEGKSGKVTFERYVFKKEGGELVLFNYKFGLNE